jgi:anticodon-binding protein
MISGEPIESPVKARARESGPSPNSFAAAEVTAILRARGWLTSPPSPAAIALRPPERPEGVGEDGAPNPELDAWLADAAALLGPHAADREALAELLALIFHYDARAILQSPESHAVLTREGAREVIRELAHLVLEGPEIDSDRFKEIVTALKGRLRLRGRELFHPLRLALAGRAAEGALDRVVLLLDRAARLPFRVRVKSARQRMLEFCAAME